jgi:hypothetical protein
LYKIASLKFHWKILLSMYLIEFISRLD